MLSLAWRWWNDERRGALEPDWSAPRAAPPRHEGLNGRTPRRKTTLAGFSMPDVRGAVARVGGGGERR